MRIRLTLTILMVATTLAPCATADMLPSEIPEMHLQSLTCSGGSGYKLRLFPVTEMPTPGSVLTDWPVKGAIAVAIQRHYVGDGTPDFEGAELIGLELPKLQQYSQNGLPGRAVFALADFSGRVRETLPVIAAQSSLRISNLDDGTSWLRARLAIGAGAHKGSKAHTVNVSCIFPWRVE